MAVGLDKLQMPSQALAVAERDSAGLSLSRMGAISSSKVQHFFKAIQQQVVSQGQAATMEALLDKIFSLCRAER